MNFHLLYGYGALFFTLNLIEIDATIKQFDVVSVQMPELGVTTGRGCLAYFPTNNNDPTFLPRFILMLGRYPSSKKIEKALKELHEGATAAELRKINKRIDSGDKSVQGMHQVLLSQITSYSTSGQDNSVTIVFGEDNVKAVVTLLSPADREGLKDILDEAKIPLRN